MLIVGNYCGEISMSGVNIGGQVTFILTNLIVGLCTGGIILIGQNIGKQDEKGVKETTSTLISFLLICAVVITFLMFFLKDAILTAIKTPLESYTESRNYLEITLTGIIFIFLYNGLSGILRGMGDSKRPMIFIIISCITNIIGDLILVAIFKMGAKGAAIATVFSQGLSVILCIVYLSKHNFVFDFKPSSFKINKKRLMMILSLGTPSAIQNGVTSISFLFITTMVNTFGVSASAAVGVVSKINGFAIMPAIAMSQSISTLSAQCFGANNKERAKKALFTGLSLAYAISLVIFVLVQLFPAQILQLFNDSISMLQSGTNYMRTFTFDYLFIPALFCLNGLFVAAGHTKFTFINSILSSLVLRIPASYILGLVLNLGLIGVGAGAPVASIGSLTLCLWFFFSGRWKTNTVEKLENKNTTK